MKYANLYLNSEYSLLSSTCRIEKICAKAKEYGYDSLAITDDGNMYGTIKFYKACLKNDLKPIIGLKLKYQYNDKTSSILLYAMNNIGYQNLMKICSIQKINKGIIDLHILNNYAFGIIAVLSSSESFIYNSLLDEKTKNQGISEYQILKNIFTNVYLGISKTNSFEKRNYHQIINNAINNNIDMVGLVKVQMMDETDQKTLQVLSLIKGTTEPLEIKKNYFIDINALTKEFNDYQFLLENTKKIVEKCNVTIKFGEYQHPRFQENIDANLYLQELCYKGLNKRLANKRLNNYKYQEYLDRLNYELSIINKMGYSDYFLIVWDFIKFAKNNNIMVGPGRGSAAASLVSYSLGITNVDPIEYNLIFERFLNPERVSMPDIDTDFQDDRRDEVIKYVGKRYTKERVAHIITFGSFAVKSAIRETAKALKLSDVRFNQINKYIHNDHTQTIQKNLTENEEIIDLCKNYPDILEVLNIAARIEGLPRNTSTHAAGIVITKNDLVLSTPIEEGLDGIYQTQYPSEDLESLGLLKMDFLGLINLTNIQKCCELIKKTNPTFKLPTTFNDQKTYQLILSGDVKGVFQIENEGMKKTLIDMKVSSINEIAQAIALYRPGPMKMIPTFLSRKFKLEKITYPHPDLKPILEETYGTIVYQEQVLNIARKFAGFSYGKADLLRRAISKKKKSEMEKLKSEFIMSSIKKGYQENTAREIFDYIEKFADYGFNKAHSVSYAIVCYYTAFLKANYYSYYVAVLMNNDALNEDSIKSYMRSLQKKNIKIKAPDINLSGLNFNVYDNNLILPLTKITSINESKAKEIIKLQPYKNYQDFIEKTSNLLNQINVENIIYSNALDSFNLTKKSMIDNYNNIINRMKYAHISELLDIKYTIDEYDYGYLLEKEKAALGINIVYNLFYRFQKHYQNQKLIKIINIRPNTQVTTIGVIKDIKEIKTKTNEKMAFANIEDDTSIIEIILFTRIYEQIEIENNNLVEIMGNVQINQKTNKLQIVINNIKKI